MNRAEKSSVKRARRGISTRLEKSDARPIENVSHYPLCLLLSGGFAISGSRNPQTSFPIWVSRVLVRPAHTKPMRFYLSRLSLFLFLFIILLFFQLFSVSFLLSSRLYIGLVPSFFILDLSAVLLSPRLCCLSRFLLLPFFSLLLTFNILPSRFFVLFKFVK